MTCRPTPTVAALGRVISGGTSTVTSWAGCTRQASRQPARSWSAVKARWSSRLTGTLPPVTWILHFLQVP